MSDAIVPSWQDLADRWMAAYDAMKVERDAAEADAERLAAAARADGHSANGETVWPHHPDCTGCAALAAHDARGEIARPSPPVH